MAQTFVQAKDKLSRGLPQNKARRLLNVPAEVVEPEPEAFFDLADGAFVLRVLVLDREHVVVADLAQRRDERAPVDAARAGHPVAPPAGLPDVVGELPAERAVAVLPLGEHLGVLGVRVENALAVLARRAEV